MVTLAYHIYGILTHTYNTLEFTIQGIRKAKIEWENCRLLRLVCCAAITAAWKLISFTCIQVEFNIQLQSVD